MSTTITTTPATATTMEQAAAEAILLDDPSKDPVGTRRTEPGNRTCIKTDKGDWLVYINATDTDTLRPDNRTVKGWDKL